MKFENNWRQKSIESLEKENWGDVDPAQSGLVQRVLKLRKLPLDKFTIDDIRCMIGQQTGLPWLLELALEILEKNLFAEGDYYEGDLLNAILQIKPANWRFHKKYWVEFDKLISNRLEELNAVRPRLAIDNFYSSKFD
jgi:hypothetical protein